MGKLFGTDGIRGVVNAGLDADLAYKVGLAAAQVLAKNKKSGEKPLVTIGKDTRISGDLLKGSLISGLCTAGADVLDLGTLPTPGVAWVTVDEKADAGIVISASHNPFEHNGIKIFNGKGFKLSDELEEKIEDIVLFGHNNVPMKTHGEIGKVSYVAPKASEDYIDHLESTIDSTLGGLRILVDCANGAASATAARLFDRFSKLRTDVINADPDGVNINEKCGSTHMDSLAAMVKAGGYDIGIAFDGDADRVLCVDGDGEVVDGDMIMAILALDMKARGRLKNNTVVGTIMSNLGFIRFCEANDIRFAATKVGDRYVLEEMLLEDYAFGGEQSGHIIFKDFATTGDGQLTAVQILSQLKRTGEKLSEAAKVMTRYPQFIVNIPCTSEKKVAFYTDYEVKSIIEDAKKEIGDSGRLIARPSGTEPLIRVMAEGDDSEKIERIAEETAEKLARQLDSYN